MDQLIWIMTTVVIVAAIAVLSIIRIRQSFKEKNNGSLKKDASSNGALRALAISLAVGGIVFGTDRFIGYSFFGASILISVIDIIKYRRTT
jgi:hypothetical protein